MTHAAPKLGLPAEIGPAGAFSGPKPPLHGEAALKARA
jgi:hypothetical protein